MLFQLTRKFYLTSVPLCEGGPFDKNDFLKELNILDDTIVDFAPLVTRFEKQYAKKFLPHPAKTE